MLASAALLTFFATHADRPLVWLPTGLLLGGAVGNLIDRTARGAVTDFIKLPRWPAFNVADIAITFGVLALLYVLEAAASDASWRCVTAREAAGERLDVFLAGAAGSRARGAAADRRRAR